MDISKSQKSINMQPQLARLLSKSRRSIFFGASAFSIGIALLCLKAWLLEFLTASVLVLKPNTMLENTWRKPPIEIPTNVYFFNWTNPEDFHNFSTKPKLQQVGPYRFMQKMEKVKVVWNDNNTVTFNQVRSWHFDKSQPNGNLSDRITTLNAITMAGSHYVRNWSYFAKKAVSILLATVAPEVHITRNVNQLLFEGYDDLIVDLTNYLPFIASEIPRFDRFGWFRLRNGSADFDGVFNMANGVNGNFELRNWNYFNETPYFEGSCAKVSGSGGELYSRKLTRDHLEVFISDICRHLLLDYEEDVVVNGILGYKYKIGDGVLDNGTLIPENKCYCAGDCMPSGMINVSSCRYGLPTYGSLPNFYQADPVYLDAVEGLKPEKIKHEAYIIIEPNTGTPLKASMKLQLNILIHPIEDIAVFQNVPKMFFPLLWAEQEAELPADMVLMLKIYLNAPYILGAISILLIAIGLYVLIFIGYKPVLIAMFKKLYTHKQRRPTKAEEVPLQEGEEMSYFNVVINDECT